MVERQARQAKRALRPAELRDILVRRVFGIDRDAEACRVSELSLLLTMLDYIEPPDLVTNPTFKLPTLAEKNIFQGDFFEEGVWGKVVEKGFDWVVGNPPWYGVAAAAEGLDAAASRWMEDNANEQPVVQRQVAEAFAWHSRSITKATSGVALLMPASTLFSEQSDFRRRFFATVDVSLIANFANLRRVLFAERAETPAIALFFDGRAPEPNAEIHVFSPFIANQEANRPPQEGTQRATWSIVVNRSEVRTVARGEIESGQFLPWKIAMWGTHRDRRLCRKLSGLSTLGDIESTGRLVISQGLELRDPRETSEGLEPVPHLIGALTYLPPALRGIGRIHTFPAHALAKIPKERAFVRKRSGLIPLKVVNPPHVIVHEARNFAVFSDELLVVPSRQVGIAGSKREAMLLRALALYISSDLTTYHQFFDSPQEGIRGGRANLASLRRLPVPFTDMTDGELAPWAELHGAIVARERTESRAKESFRLVPDGPTVPDLEREMNALVYRAVGLTEHDRFIVEDFVHVRRALADGLIGRAAVAAPTETDMKAYLDVLASELDGFLAPSLKRRHRVVAVTEAHTGMVEIRLVARRDAATKHLNADTDVGRELRAVRTKLERAHSQWLYFDRNLFLYDDESAFILKPMQRVWWTRSQALVDADTLIAETIGAARTA